MRKTIQKLLGSSRAARVLLRLAVRLMAPKNLVGVVGVIFNDEGRILVAEHVYRSRYRWGLPGGWVERGEDPAAALARELREELSMEIEIGEVLLCRTEATEKRALSAQGIGVAFACRAVSEPVVSSKEILRTRWMAPEEIGADLLPFQRTAIQLALERTSRGRQVGRSCYGTTD